MAKQPKFFSLAVSQVRGEFDLRERVREWFFFRYRVSLDDAKVDFLVYPKNDAPNAEAFLWAETKFEPTDIDAMFAQLILTIKKKIDDGEMPPKYLGVFDREKIAFLEYHQILPVFNLNDFNWSERPSAVSKKTINRLKKYMESVSSFDFKRDDEELKEFISKNFVVGNAGTTKAQINKNNFVTLYNKWCGEVLPSINLNADEWKDLKKIGVGDGDFYLADLLSENNKTISDKLNIVLQTSYYESRKQFADKLKFYYEKIGFRDDGTAHAAFWEKYERPPKKEYHKHIIERRDLLVPQNIRERKGAYFTPAIWVEKSQEYLEKVFGENWQEEYYVWDCCAGTCNLLAGLTEKHRLWASTIDQPDVDIVHEIIGRGALNLLPQHVFQFDFLNDDFKDLPKSLKSIINDPEKRKKLIIYMNPPYAEHGSTITKEHKVGVATEHHAGRQYGEKLGAASRELYALFLMRIHEELQGCQIGLFSKLKHLQANNFSHFRQNFSAKYLRGFLVPATTFDNVKGRFPIAFQVWDTGIDKKFTTIEADVYDKSACYLGKAKIRSTDHQAKMTQWMKESQADAANTVDDKENRIGHLNGGRTDFQNQNLVFIVHPEQPISDPAGYYWVYKQNLMTAVIYFSVRHCIKATWLNDRDQFLFPNDGYETDTEFQHDCLIFTLFHHQNRICSNGGENHWLPFTAKEVDAKDNFQSTLMSDFLKKRKEKSSEAQAVYESGKALWRYYHETIKHERKALVDASLYEIREYFKGRNEKGKMKTKSVDERFNVLDAELRHSLTVLAAKIRPKVYLHGFLKK